MMMVILRMRRLWEGNLLAGSWVTKQSNTRCTRVQALLELGHVTTGPVEPWLEVLSFRWIRLTFAALLLSFSKRLLAFLMFERQLSRFCASCCHESRQTSAISSSLFSWSLYRFLGPLWFCFPALSSPKSIAFGMRVSSILATLPAQPSCSWRMMDSRLGMCAFVSTSSFQM